METQARGELPGGRGTGYVPQAGLHGPLRLVTNPRPPLLAQEGLEGLLGGWTLGLGKAEGDIWPWVPCPNAVGPLSGSSDPSASPGRARGRLWSGPLTFRQSWGCVSTSGYCTWGSSRQGPGRPSPPPSLPGGHSPCRAPAGLSASARGSGPLALAASTDSHGLSWGRRVPSSAPGSPGGSGWRPRGSPCLQGPSPRAGVRGTLSQLLTDHRTQHLLSDRQAGSRAGVFSRGSRPRPQPVRLCALMSTPNPRGGSPEVSQVARPWRPCVLVSG